MFSRLPEPDTIKILGLSAVDTVVWASHATDWIKLVSALGTAVYVWIKVVSYLMHRTEAKDDKK